MRQSTRQVDATSPKRSKKSQDLLDNIGTFGTKLEEVKREYDSYQLSKLDIEKAKKELADATTELKETHLSLGALKGELKDKVTLENDIKERTEELIDLNTEVEKTKNKAKDIIDEARSVVESFKSDKLLVEGEIKEAKSELNATKDSIKAEGKALDNAKGKTADALKALDSAVEQVEDAKTAKDSIEGNIDSLNGTKDQLGSDIDELEAQKLQRLETEKESKGNVDKYKAEKDAEIQDDKDALVAGNSDLDRKNEILNIKSSAYMTMVKKFEVQLGQTVPELYIKWSK